VRAPVCGDGSGALVAAALKARYTERVQPWRCGTMRGRTVTALFFVAILSLLAADISVGCGSQAYVYGPVSQKFATSSQEANKFIEINGQMYEVPVDFYNAVEVGDTVRFNGKQWAVVKKAGAPVTPATTP
jgi:hypothetical protein